MTNEEAQKVWDACLIRGWRDCKTLRSCFLMFHHMTGCKAEDFNLLRATLKVPWDVPVRVFMAQRLPKIGDRLFSHGPETDLALLRFLQGSKYTTSTSDMRPDREREAARRATRRDQAFVKLNSHHYDNRNHSTDWAVVK